MAVPLSDNPFAILTFIAAPAVFTNASSVLALGTGNRLARVVDRSRHLTEEFRKKNVADLDADDEFTQINMLLLGRLEIRAAKLVSAMTAFYTAVGAFAAASLVSVLGASLANTSMQMPFNAVAIASLVAGSVGFVGLASGSTLLIQETRLAVVSLREESQMIRRQVSRS
jgi:hypothetical protein